MVQQPQEYLILGFLMNAERHGYEIHHLFSRGVGHIWHVGISQVYALLKKMEAEEKVVASIQTQDHRPARHIFAITPKGRDAFLQWVYTPLEKIRDLRLDFLAKLFFIRELNLAGIDDLIAKQIHIFQDQLREIKNKDENSNDGFDHLVYQFKIVQLEAVLSWLRECEQYVRH